MKIHLDFGNIDINKFSLNVICALSDDVFRKHIMTLSYNNVAMLLQRAASELKALEEDHSALKNKMDACKARYLNIYISVLSVIPKILR